MVFVFGVVFFAVNVQASAETDQNLSRGEGVGSVSGYVISDVHYSFAGDPLFISAVQFELDRPAAEVLIRFDQASDEFFSCHHNGDQEWICELTGVELCDLYTMRVFATR
jgi:hypothetical protein